jgi:dTDP-4-dehydrorhamnose reductase
LRIFSIIVLGSKGMLGTALVQQLRAAGHRVRAVDRSQFDALRDPVRQLDLTGVDYCINALGMINRRPQAGPADFYLVNSLLPRLLADYCQAQSVHLIHISTDCVYNGQRGQYTENDAPTAADLYGRSKSLGEPANCLVLRTSIIGPERQNYYSLLNWFLAQSHCRGYQNHWWNGMTTIQLSRLTDQIIQRDLYIHGLRHVFGDDVTKLELLRMMREAFQAQIEITPADDMTARDTRLRTAYPEFVGQLEIPNLYEQIAELPRFSDIHGHWRPLPELEG